MNEGAVQQSIQRVLVLGDLALETLLIPETSTQKHRTRKLSDYVGATIIRDIIVGALNPTDKSKGVAAEVKVYPGDSPQKECPRCQLRELVAVFGKFPKKSHGNRSDTVWRVGSTYRTRPDTGGIEDYDSHLEEEIESCPTPDVVVIFEDDKQFRNAFERLGERRGSRRKDSKSTLIVGLSEKVIPTSIETAKKLFDTGATIAIVTADGLRSADLDIASNASIEQTVQGLSNCLNREPLKKILGLCSHLIVLLEHSGILCISNRGKRGTIHFSPNFDRPAQTHPHTYGRVPGRMAIVLGSVARFVCKAGTQTDISSLDLDPALRLSLAAYDRMFENGYDEKDPFKTARNVLSEAERGELKNTLTSESDSKRRPFLISSLSFSTDPASLEDWSRLDSLEKPDIGKEIVLNGVEKASRMPPPEDKPSLDDWWPSAEIACPFMQMGRIQTFDKDEVERLANLAKLIGKYHDDPKWLTPLSIAVFGPPGAGKSFAVKQLMKTVNPAIKDSSILTFNLAQFNSLELLTEAFHQVQDQVLFSDDVPLVIFDEFDSAFRDSALGWLKFFLAPMEDGIFRGQTSNYKVGRALFLFAGGTAFTFDEFAGREAVPERAKANAARTKRREAVRKAAKVPDFVSRLMAHLDVLGINRPEGSKSERPGELTRRTVRRGTLLRSLLEEFAEPIIEPNQPARISLAVIDAFLNDQVVYRNQARSMKAIVRSSQLIGNQFLRASLPPRSVIDLHAEGWPFES